MRQLILSLLLSTLVLGCGNATDSQSNEGDQDNQNVENTEGSSTRKAEKVESGKDSEAEFGFFYVNSEGENCGDAVNPADAPDGADIPAICDIFEGYSLYKDWNFYGSPVLRLMAGGDVNWETSLSPQCDENHRYGEKMEVRTWDGHAFAVIIRCTCMDYPDQDPTQTPVAGKQVLMVRGLYTYDEINKDFDVAATSNANQAARDYADQTFSSINNSFQ